MAIYNPPTEILPIFNIENWEYGDQISLTQSAGDLRYLRLTGGTERGLVTFNDGLLSLSNVSIGSYPTLCAIELQGDFNQEFGDLGTTQRITGRNIILTNGVGSPDPYILQVIKSGGGDAMSIADNGNLIVNANTLYVDAVNNRVGIKKVPTTNPLEVDGSIDITTGSVYRINNVSVLSSTTLGSAVVSSSLTSVGTLSNLTLSTTGFLRPSRVINNSITEITTNPYTITIGSLYSKYLSRLTVAHTVNLPSSTDLTGYNGLELQIIQASATTLGICTINAGSGTTIQKNSASIALGAFECASRWLMYDEIRLNWTFLNRFS